jgi:hypothetical protein
VFERGCENPLLVRVQSQMYPLRTRIGTADRSRRCIQSSPPTSFYKIYFNIPPPICLELPSVFFPFDSLTEIRNELYFLPRVSHDLSIPSSIL